MKKGKSVEIRLTEILAVLGDLGKGNRICVERSELVASLMERLGVDASVASQAIDGAVRFGALRASKGHICAR